MDLSQSLQDLLLFLPVFILSLSLHEFAHAWVADRLGDATARYMGRLTMDPMAHISIFGTVIFPSISMLIGAPLFGWANPVPVDMRNFRKPLQHMAIVAAAGPASNIIISFISAFLLSQVIKNAGASIGHLGPQSGMISAAIRMLALSVQTNLLLAFFNLIPLPPLDGSRILQGFVSLKTAKKIDSFAPYSFYILMGLAFTGALRVLALPMMGMMMWMFGLFGIPV